MAKTSLFRAFLMTSLIGLGGCASYDQFRYVTEEFEIPSQVFNADYAQTWQAVLQIMAKYDLELQNQEAGVVKTRWIDNTLEVNFADSFGGNDAVKAARFKLILNVVKGFRGNNEVTKVTVFKRQLKEQDFLQGWKVVPTDGIAEKSLLYRIERLLSIDKRLRAIEKEKAKELGLSREGFAVNHPGGWLGKQLRMKVRDLMRESSVCPRVQSDQVLKDKSQGDTFARALRDQSFLVRRQALDNISHMELVQYAPNVWAMLYDKRNYYEGKPGDKEGTNLVRRAVRIVGDLKFEKALNPLFSMLQKEKAKELEASF